MQKVDVEKEKAKIKEAGGLENYLKTRKTSINLLGVLVIVVVAFVLGAIVF